MRRKDIFITASLLRAFGCGIFLAACQESWHLAASQKGKTVELCLSTAPECPQTGGITPGSISVYQYDSIYDNELIWDAEPQNPLAENRISGIVSYGVPPEGWVNKQTPPALTCGKAYLVNPGANFFGLKCGGSVAVFDFQHLEAFFRDGAPAAPDKKTP